MSDTTTKPPKYSRKSHTTQHAEPDSCREGKTSIIVYSDENAGGLKESKSTAQRPRTPSHSDTQRFAWKTTLGRSQHCRRLAHALTIPPHAHNHQEEMKTNHRLAHFCILRKEKGEGRKRVSEAGGAAAASGGRPWKMPPIERNTGKRSEALFCERGIEEKN